jgi:formylglycine-generating enzyme required for sulfatase activity
MTCTDPCMLPRFLAVLIALACALPLGAGEAPPKPVKPPKKPKEAPAAAPTTAPADGLTIDLGNGLSMLFARIPAGTFQMGSPDSEVGRSTDEGPVHEVTISKPFFMGQLLVTQAQYQQVMGDNPSVTAKGGDFPVENVRWEQAVAFCAKLSEKAGKTVRLPTEAEFEYATRAGTTTRYFYGADAYDMTQLGAYSWTVQDCKNDLQPVGRKQPNPWGLYDMYGMVWQWCSDWYADSYPAGKQTDPTGPQTGTERVLRGGSWLVGPHTDWDKQGRMLPRSAVRGVTGTWYRWPAPGSVAKVDRGYTQVGRIGFRVVVEEK